MSDPRAQLNALREAIVAGSPAQAAQLLMLLDTLDKDMATLSAQRDRLRQDVEDAEHARDAANLARMKVMGQLNTLQKILAAAVPEVPSGKDPQSDAQRRVEWLLKNGGTDPSAAEAAKSAEMEAPMPGRAVLEAVIAGERKFTKAQLEFSIAEAMVLTGWQMTPLELTQKGEPWLADLILQNQSDLA
ncbi:hypothetical protein [Arenimonas aestuarii]